MGFECFAFKITAFPRTKFVKIKMGYRWHDYINFLDNFNLKETVKAKEVNNAQEATFRGLYGINSPMDSKVYFVAHHHYFEKDLKEQNKGPFFVKEKDMVS